MILEQSNKLEGYLKTVCQQIRWKKAHGVISEELENHIIDQKNAFVSKGFTEENAMDKAIEEMGDPILVGSELDRTHKPKPEWSIIFLTGVLLFLGFLIRELISNDVSNAANSTGSNVFITIFGIASMVIAYFLDYTIIGKHPKLIYFGLMAIMISSMVTFPSTINISQRYMGQFFYAKFIMLLFPTAFAGIIYSTRNRGYEGIVLSGIYCIFPALLCLQIPSLSSLAMYTITCLIILTYAILKGWFNVNKLRAMLVVYIPTLITSCIALKFMKQYQIARLKNALNPSLDPLGSGFLANVTRLIIKNAKLIGHNSYGIDTDNLLPNLNTDFLLTHLIDRLGWISFIFLMMVLLIFIVRALKLVHNQENVLGSLVSVSVIATFIMQVIIYVLNNLGFPLIAPLTLPLISYGRTGTTINLFLIGIMLSVFRNSTIYSSKETNSITNKKTFNFVDGKIIIDLNR